MLAVVSASDLVLFLVAWEIMSLVSYFLSFSIRSIKKSMQAGTVYIVMTHFGTALITAAFLIMHRYTQSFDVLAVKQAAYLIPDGAKCAVFLLLSFRLRARRAFVPLISGLPMAHTAGAQPHLGYYVGVMIKIGIYGIIRFAIFTLGISQLWQGRLSWCCRRLLPGGRYLRLNGA